MARNLVVSDSGERVAGRRRRPRRSKKSKNIPGAVYQFTVTVSGYPVGVFHAPHLSEADNVGEYDNQEIHLRSDTPGGVVYADRLLHEAIHAISSIAMSSEDRLTERQVNALSTVLVDTLPRNPDFRSRFLACLTAEEPV